MFLIVDVSITSYAKIVITFDFFYQQTDDSIAYIYNVIELPDSLQINGLF